MECSFLFHTITSDVCRHPLGPSYVSLLARLVATPEQDNHSLLADRIVDAIALADIDTEFTDTTSDRPVVPGIAFLNAVDANQDLRLCPLVSQPSQPAQESITFGHFIFHSYIVSKRRQPSNTPTAAEK